MPGYYKTWTVLPHLPIEELTENLWRIQGSLPNMPLKRVTTVARRENGELVIHNAMAMDEPTMTRLLAWGTPSYLLVPNGYHRLDAFAFKARFPEIKVLCPRGSTKKVAQVVAVDGAYQDFPADDAIQLDPIPGLADAEGVMVVKSSDGVTLVFNDLLFNMPHGKGVMGLVFRHLTQSTGGPRISRLVRWFLLKDRPALRDQLLQLAATPDLRRIIVSHHRTISDDPAAVLRGVAASL